MKEANESLICYNKKETNNNLLLFVHGYNGSAGETFGHTPEMLTNAPQMAGWDIYSVGYSSDLLPSLGIGLWSAIPDIRKIATYLNTLISNQFEDYERIALVAHSMGGLVVQRFLLDCSNDILSKISHVMLFGTPSNGLNKAVWSSFWNRQIGDLSADSDFIKQLRADWDNKFQYPTQFVFKVVAGTTDEFVPTSSSLKVFPEKLYNIIEGNHVTMIKPLDNKDVNHQSYTLILKTLTGQNVQYLSGNFEEINILLGQYNSIIQKHLPNATLLTPKNLGYLVFALECSNRQDEAIAVLDQHPSSSTNTDLMGYIGGRHKRRYLVRGFQTDFDTAFSYYSKALEMAKQKADRCQIFYHAINLAFLSAITDETLNMVNYANLALANCSSSSSDLWEIATYAEANLYLRNWDEAKKYYRLAANSSDARNRYSIYSNAYHGYCALVNNGAKNTDFVKFLENVLLNNQQEMPS